MQDVDAGPGHAGPLLEISASTSNGTTTLLLKGEVDLSNASQVEEMLRAASRESSGPVVIDLAGLTFIDSSGIRLFLSLSVAEDGASRCAFANPSAAVRRVLDIAGVRDRLPWKDGPPG
ncbi:MAG: hypothetical protein QOG62_475 [Thermoleophilaceae bacterium]|nr:hypothetical protein [Thermoleophilaceae bacterium]